MTYGAKSFTTYIKSLIRKGEIKKALNILSNALYNDNQFQNNLIILSSRYNQLYEREMMGLGRDQISLNQISFDILALLEKIEAENPR